MISLIGAGLVLAAYIGHQAKWMHSDSLMYSLLNVLGSGVLACIALKPLQLGFLVTEGVWLSVSLVTLFRRLSSRCMRKT